MPFDFRRAAVDDAVEQETEHLRNQIAELERRIDVLVKAGKSSSYFYGQHASEEDRLRRELERKDALLREAADMLVYRDTDAADRLIAEIRCALEGEQ